MVVNPNCDLSKVRFRIAVVDHFHDNGAVVYYCGPGSMWWGTPKVFDTIEEAVQTVLKIASVLMLNRYHLVIETGEIEENSEE